VVHTGQEDKIEGWVHTITGLDAVERRKISFHYLESNPSHPACSLLLLYWLSHLDVVF
jgi:hypothetical protein